MIIYICFLQFNKTMAYTFALILMTFLRFWPWKNIHFLFVGKVKGPIFGGKQDHMKWKMANCIIAVKATNLYVLKHS